MPTTVLPLLAKKMLTTLTLLLLLLFFFFAFMSKLFVLLSNQTEIFTFLIHVICTCTDIVTVPILIYMIYVL